MSDLRPHNQQVWDRLIDLLYACDESVTDADVEAELKQAGIDISPAIRRLNEMMKQRVARQELARAGASHKLIVARLARVVGPTVADLRAGVQEFIARTFSGPEQVAHFHKLEKAASDEDLQSLMDDLTRLASLKQSEGDNGSKTQ
jgi:hypothetical protein